MKKIIAIMLVLVLSAGILAGCGSSKSDGLNIVCTIFPEYDWVMNILGTKAEDANVTMLLDNGVDLHSYQPSADDIVKISTCDVFIYIGGESDAWVDDALKEAVNEDMIVIDLLEVLGSDVKEEETVEGMEAENHDGEEEAEEEPEYDEHVWLSLKKSVILCNYISEKLCEKDPDNAMIYNNNCASYTQSLNDLDQQYQMTVDAAKNDTLVFADRFPFRYLTDDYNIKYYAAFAGCSAESEASFETIIFLANKVDELGLDSVIAIEGTEHDIPMTVVDSTQSKDQSILTLDSMQAITSSDVENGETYLSVMQKNLSVLKEALN